MRTYTVKPGDTLPSIARMTYGEENELEALRMLYQANPKSVNTSGDLTDGTVLNLPSFERDI